MPELPDVEHFRRRVDRHARGRRIEEVVTTDPGILRNVDAGTLDGALRGHRFERPERHGKWLVAWTTGPAVLLHFGMTGDVTWSPGPEGRHRHDRVVFVLDRGELRYRNMRKLGGLWLAHDAEEVGTVTARLGPDALAVDRAGFRERLDRRRGRVKPALMDQTVVAGAGNLTVDEALWRARIHPAARIEDLTDAERNRLYRELTRVLETWVERFGDLPRGWLIRARGPDAACPRCRSPLSRTVIGGRTTYFCPSCQPPPSSAGPPSPRTPAGTTGRDRGPARRRPGRA